MTSFAPASVMSVLGLFALGPRVVILYVMPPVIYLKFFRFQSVGSSIAVIFALVAGVAISIAAIYWSVKGCMDTFAA
jgi:hypothetical protein